MDVKNAQIVTYKVIMDFELNDFRKALPKVKDVQTFIMDPPYNIKFDYQSKYKDNLDPEEYKQTIKEVLDIAYDVSKDSASFFMINYPEVTAELYSTIKDTKWNTHQWITWVYNSNFGFSSKRFTKASRAVLWLVKEEPKIKIDAVVQPYKNLNDKRIQKQLAKGKRGCNLYNWWDINICKFNAKEKLNYVNQIPFELLSRLILTTTDNGDLVVDPMCGSGSTLVAANNLEREAWGCDINENLKPIWEDILAQTRLM